VSLDFGGRSISRYPIISIYKPFRNKLLNWFVGRSRSKDTDNSIVYPRDNLSFKKIIKALKTPIVFYYIGDEDLGKKNSEFANFFDETKYTLISITKIASLSKATVIPCINHYCFSKNKYVTYIDQPIEKFPTGDTSDDAEIINRAFEKLINRNLEQYMWSLRLFQTRPNGQKYPYSK
jgi:lauroyl-KDO2-lipid IV(A) myristoyltransferase